METMTVGKLKQIISDLDDDTKIRFYSHDDNRQSFVLKLDYFSKIYRMGSLKEYGIIQERKPEFTCLFWVEKQSKKAIKNVNS